MNPSQDVEPKPGTSTFSSGRFLNRRIAAAYSKGVHFEPPREDKGGEAIVERGTGRKETERGERVQRHGMVVARKAGNNDNDDDDNDRLLPASFRDIFSGDVPKNFETLNSRKDNGRYFSQHAQ
ncbi:hypothetical protein ALC57_03392 [Trachymyrmex cornetzi]|uniref:Uncharacterized protein n=1 Tax=Trachymyrmex cornetzi TaxID=471704 RepID=A0A195EFK1_9HYME|nr:hypothetical protein ALC57_03392 [Trachymyrmex cornetzi]